MGGWSFRSCSRSFLEREGVNMLPRKRGTVNASSEDTTRLIEALFFYPLGVPFFQVLRWRQFQVFLPPP